MVRWCDRSRRDRNCARRDLLHLHRASLCRCHSPGSGRHRENDVQRRRQSSNGARSHRPCCRPQTQTETITETKEEVVVTAEPVPEDVEEVVVIAEPVQEEVVVIEEPVPVPQMQVSGDAVATV